MHGDVMNVFKKIGSQKRTILKLEAEIFKIKKDFELFKNEHASLSNEQFAIPPKESSSINVPKSPKSKDIGTCEACPRLQIEIVSLKSKIEQASSASINFAKRSPKTTNSQFKKLPKRRFQNKYRSSKIHEHKLRCKIHELL